MPRIAALMGVSDVVLSMWIAGTTGPTTIKLLEIRKFLERNRLEHVDGSMKAYSHILMTLLGNSGRLPMW